MRTGRVEAFSDGVLAILITIMVLELPKPAGPTWTALGHDVPVLLAYVLSFAYIGVYWNNHHHMFQAVRRISGGVLWANLNLLFWLSLLPFVTAWITEDLAADKHHELETVPLVAYGIDLLAAGAAYYLLQAMLIRAQGPGSALAAAVGRDLKGKASVVLYVAGVLLTLVDVWVGVGVYAVVALLWIVPDRRVERQLAHERRAAVEARED